MQKISAKYRLWFEYSGIVKKSLSAVVTQILKGLLYCFYELYIQISEVATLSLQI